MYEGVVFDRQLGKASADLRGDLDEVCSDACIIGAGVLVCFEDNEHKNQDGKGNSAKCDPSS
jgi:hypothetical protein